MRDWLEGLRTSEGPDPALRHAAWVARCVGHGPTAPLSGGDLDDLARDLTEHHFERGTVLFAAGSLPSGVWLVKEGAIGLFAGAPPNRVLLSVMHAGDVDGDLALLLDMATPYGAETIEPSVCLRLDADAFSRLLATQPALARRWLSSLAGRLAHSQQRLVDLLGVPLVQQVARVLLAEATEGQVPYSQSTLAALLGARRPSVNKAVKSLSSRGLITVSYRMVRIDDLAGLTTVAATGG
jgi:CRP-like cAMP-binding protein